MNSTRHRVGYARAGTLTALLGLALSACALSTEPDEAPVAATEEPIIAGVSANGAKLNAIGSIGNLFVDPETQAMTYQPYCSGSLIGKQTVLTAKHCIQFFDSDTRAGLRTAFAIGPNGFAPVRVVEVVQVQGAPVDTGGFIDFGHDVGVMYLAEKVTNLTPLKLGTLKRQDLGKKFIEIGYGVRDNSEAYGTRRTGNATLRATRGRVFEIIFGSFAQFKDWFEAGGPNAKALFNTGPVGPAAFLPIARSIYESLGDSAAGGAGGAPGGPSPGGGKGGTSSEGGGGSVPAGGSGDASDPDEFLHYIYDNTLLTEGYEAVFGGANGDAQACYGDSGSPIVRADAAGNLVAYGVVSGGIGSNQLVCDYGGVDAVFGPDVTKFLQAAAQWVDPCKGVSEAGKCAGKVAQRCTSPLEGPRRLVKFNCGSLGQGCAIQSDGTAGCSD